MKAIKATVKSSFTFKGVIFEKGSTIIFYDFEEGYYEVIYPVSINIPHNALNLQDVTSLYPSLAEYIKLMEMQVFDLKNYESEIPFDSNPIVQTKIEMLETFINNLKNYV